MIISKISGGLGNQMFQYAIGRSLSIYNKVDFKMDISFYNTDKKRKYTLDKFNIVEKFATEKEIKHFKRYEEKSGRRNLLHNIFFANRKKYYKEKMQGFSKEVFDLKPPIYIDGVFINEKYLKDVEHIIRRDLTLKNPLSAYYSELVKRINNTNAVALMIRRGDFVTEKKTNSFHGLCSLDYYYEAIKQVCKFEKNPTFFISSDDIEWAKENLKIDHPVYFIDAPIPIDYENLIVMSKCRHFIIANSTYSWWIAWLSDNEDKKVYSPSRWINKPGADAKSDFLPESWITINK